MLLKLCKCVNAYCLTLEKVVGVDFEMSLSQELPLLEEALEALRDKV